MAAGFVSGELITAIAMTEPAAGSDLQADQAPRPRREGDDWITQRVQDLHHQRHPLRPVIVAAQDRPRGRPPRDEPARRRGGMRRLRARSQPGQVGHHSQDTAELFFADVRVPGANLLGEEGRGFHYLMRNLPQERLAIAVPAVARHGARARADPGLRQERKAFGQPIGTFQASRFALAEMKTKTRAHADLRRPVHPRAQRRRAHRRRGRRGQVRGPPTCSGEVVDRCVQLHGGYGYMNEYEVTRLWRDARVQRIYGGTNEIMKEIVGRGAGLLTTGRSSDAVLDRHRPVPALVHP